MYSETGEETPCSSVAEQGLLKMFFKLQLGYGWAVNERNMLLVKLSHHIMSQHPKILTSQRGREEELPALLGWASLTRTQKWSFCLFFYLFREGW